VSLRASVAPRPGAHGGDGERLAAALGVDPARVLDLSLSLNPCAPDVAARARDRLDCLRRYPDPTQAAAALAGALGVDPDRLVLTNGGAEAIALVAGEVKEGWVEPPDFSLYERHLARVRPRAGRWRSNPCNPTGELAPRSATAAVWDEAFWPLATGTWTRGDGGASFVVGSLTKIFGCPGLRVGYAVCPDPAAAARLRAAQPEWSVSALACALVPDLLDTADLVAWAGAIGGLRSRLVDVLLRAGWAAAEVRAAAAPWVLVANAGGLRERLSQHAILVRDCASFGLEDTVRVAVPDERGLERLALALSEGAPGR
jgi:histidinol-phosphate/aromatic aminotransferase/cobyric acid decarboxylase-like protein